MLVNLSYKVLASKSLENEITDALRSLEKEMPAEYTLIDKYFPIYQQTYTTQTSREDCNEIRKLVKDLEKRAI